MEKREWETPRVLVLSRPAQAVGNCVDGSTATVVMPMCGPGNQPDTFYEACDAGGLAAGACINGTAPGF